MPVKETRTVLGVGATTAEILADRNNKQAIFKIVHLLTRIYSIAHINNTK